MSPPAARDSPPRRPCLLWFAAVAGLVFLEQTWPYWRAAGWLAGVHADGPFHYACELARLSPTPFANDLAIQSNQSLGFYETTYRAVGGLVKFTGWSLVTTNLILCWTGNLLYLAGVFTLLRRLGLADAWCGVGALLAGQPYGLIMMTSGVAHSLAIPRELWLWPMPWLVMWFAFGQRTGPRRLLFYGALGAIYGFTYPLWAALFGFAFGLVDGWQIAESKKYSDLAWLAAGGGLCVALVAAPALAIANTTAGAESAVLDYNQITRSVYASKGLRRYLLFVAAGLAAFWFLRKVAPEKNSPWRRLFALLVVTTGVCLIYEPFQRLARSLSLLYLGRLSLIGFLVSVVAVADRARRIFAEVKTNPRATAGMIMCLNVPDPCTGSHCKFTAKMSISMMPSQKLGVASPRLAKILQKLSSQVLTRTAAKIPRGMPRSTEMAMAAIAN